jgi:hypothetical protein
MTTFALWAPLYYSQSASQMQISAFRSRCEAFPSCTFSASANSCLNRPPASWWDQKQVWRFRFLISIFGECSCSLTELHIVFFLDRMLQVIFLTSAAALLFWIAFLELLKLALILLGCYQRLVVAPSFVKTSPFVFLLQGASRGFFFLLN